MILERIENFCQYLSMHILFLNASEEHNLEIIIHCKLRICFSDSSLAMTNELCNLIFFQKDTVALRQANATLPASHSEIPPPNAGKIPF
jgi:hypothetical protein